MQEEHGRKQTKYVWEILYMGSSCVHAFDVGNGKTFLKVSIFYPQLEPNISFNEKFDTIIFSGRESPLVRWIDG